MFQIGLSPNFFMLEFNTYLTNTKIMEETIKKGTMY